MTPEITQLLVNAGGTAVVAAISIISIIKIVEAFLKQQKETQQEFTKIITEHHRDNIKSNKEIAKQLSVSSRTIQELKTAAEAVYVQSLENVKQLRIKDQIIESLTSSKKPTEITINQKNM